ncbi:MAG: SDR family oxidoreductase [Kiritimatiellae bacterium]|nr:SDR family oxidoreductase [Kiritimatiellia bacterium]
MMTELAGHTALVTGGAVRIGRAVTLALARAGAHVVIHYRRSADAARELAAQLHHEGAQAWTIPADLADPAAPDDLIREALARAGQLTILVNNAAVFHKHGWGAVTDSALDAELQVNLCAPVLLMQAFALRVRTGVIVNLLDRRIASVDPTCVPYELSKKALAAATRSAALAWAPSIRVNAVAPGAVLPPPGEGAHYLRDRAGRIPLGGPIPPEAVAEAVLFLVRARYITGQVLFVDGGQHLLGAEPSA